ncbi:MAG: protein-L-isoaspartate(D-aspartate) O-methyltransferase [Paracoccaceae bacterium]
MPAADPSFDALARGRLVFAARDAGVTDRAVLSAIEAVDRARFVGGLFRERAYEDAALPIPCGQTISQPSVVAKMTEALQVGPRDKVLEIGTGSGYQAAVLSYLARRVYTVDRHRPLATQARATIEAMGLSTVTVIAGDGTLGLAAQAPFDRILLTAAAEDPPGPLLAQLREGGIMVLPVGQSDHVQTLLRVVKTPDGLDYSELGPVRFVPLLEGEGERD